MKFRLFSIFFISFCCISLLANEKITLSDQWFLSEKISADWQRLIPADAIPFKLKNGRCDLDTVRRETGHEKDECVVYNQFHADQDGKLSIGLGCDWWMQVFCNGTEYYSTMKFGNGINPGSSPWYNHQLQIPVKKGKNLLAVKVIRGRASFMFSCGRIDSLLPEIEPVLVKRKLPPPPTPGFGSSYQLIVLGDTHFDGSSVYHSEHVRDEKHWGQMPKLLKAAAGQITEKTFAIIQLGDLIHGHYGNMRIHSRMLLDALNALRSEFGSLPVLTVVGNHEVDEPGAAESYRQTMLPYLSRELKREISSTTFYFMKDEDLYLFIDFNEPDCEVIQEAFARHSDARYKFVITHAPVIPSDGRSCFWFLFGNGRDTLRRYFREIFLQNDVIVLTGHMHRLELLECMTDLGRITQLMVYSEWQSEKKARFVQIADHPGDYGQKLRKGIKLVTPNAKSSDGVQLLAEYQDALTRYWEANGVGFVKLDISPECVVANYFCGDSRTPSKIIRLR